MAIVKTVLSYTGHSMVDARHGYGECPNMYQQGPALGLRLALRSRGAVPNLLTAPHFQRSEV